MRKARFVAGILCCVAAAVLMLTRTGPLAGNSAFLILGITLIAISRKSSPRDD